MDLWKYFSAIKNNMKIRSISRWKKTWYIKYTMKGEIAEHYQNGNVGDPGLYLPSWRSIIKELTTNKNSTGTHLESPLKRLWQ